MHSKSSLEMKDVSVIPKQINSFTYSDPIYQSFANRIYYIL